MFGRKNNKSDAETQVQKCVEVVRGYSVSLAKEIIGKQESSNEDTFRLMTYCFALNYILIDRITFSVMPEKKRNAFSDKLFLGIRSDITKGTGVENETVTSLLSDYIAQLGPYSGKLIESQDESPQGTLFWEFSRIIKDEIGLDSLESMTIVTLLVEKSSTALMSEVRPYFESHK